MAFRIVADKSEELPEGLRAQAKQVDGKFVVDSLPEGWEIGDTVGLRKFLSEERTARKAAEKSLQAYEGIEDAAAAREALSQLKAGALKGSKEIDEFRKSLEAKVAADLAKKDKAVEFSISGKILKVDRDTLAANSFAYGYKEGGLPFPDRIDGPGRTIITSEGGASVSRFKHVICEACASGKGAHKTGLTASRPANYGAFTRRN